MIGWWENVEVGAESLLGEHAFERDAMIAFAREFDPQRFHIDEDAANALGFEGISASGWHVAAAVMRLIVEARERDRQAHASLGENLPPLGVSPGLENLRWPSPTRPGDIVTVRARVTGKRETRQPRWGLVFMQTWGVNQFGREAIRMDNRAFAARREG